MRIENLSKITALFIASAAMLIAFSAKATLTLNLVYDGVGYFVPSVVPPNGIDVNYLNAMIAVYNGGTSTYGGETYTKYAGTGMPVPATLSAATSLGPIVGGQTGGGVGHPAAQIDLGAGGYLYLIATWDEKQGADAVYYIGGLSGVIDLVNDVPGTSGNSPIDTKDLSNYFLAPGPNFVQVPEAGTVLAGALLLLPLGASTLRILRRNRIG